MSSPVTAPAKSKIVAGLLGILLGGLGAHSFYLGNPKKGVLQLVVSAVTVGIGAIWGFVEGVLILVGKIDTDAHGRPLA
ncbi:TM2 domain-containing protein [Nocardioides sp. TRM66260-LWL]|uniref:TM2 domain-containing protein n=1 Tax=Nocardioides sp. TRM66260-LWL TaxID=2874478 RepID=UPI001CC36AF6|nr:TM2 domain-containing protein [Nocardioides sp. TRM66260-LWL]MBZ5733718.1 TM2 domain-containing protein [Nocardioides sp. TRM66260-LWL]